MRRLSARELRWLIALFVLTLPAVTPRLYSSDEIQYYSYLRSLWFDRDVSFDNEYRYFYEQGVARSAGFKETFLDPLTPTGKRENFGTLGCAILWAPFFALADLATRALRATGSTLPADGYSHLYIAAAAYGSAVYAFLAVLMSIAAARQLVGNGVVAGLAVWFGTPLLFYMYAAPPFAHACSAFAVAVFVTVWLGVRGRWTARGLTALGAAAALMTMVREQDVFYAVGPAVDYAIDVARAPHRGEIKRLLRSAALGAATFIVLYSPQLVAYLALNGRFGPSRLVTRKMAWSAPHAADVLASAHHGFFVWTPLALLAIAGLALWVFLDVGARRSALGAESLEAGVRRSAFGAESLEAGVRRSALGAESSEVRRIGRCMLVMFAMQVYVSGSVASWTVAGAFGQRRFVGATILLVVGLAALWQMSAQRAARIALAAAVVVAVWWNVGLMALFGSDSMNRQRLEPRRNAYDVFVTLPLRAPQLAYRYLFDRESFYKKPGP